MTAPACPSFVGHSFPPEVIRRAFWPLFKLSLILRIVEAPLASRGILICQGALRHRSRKFCHAFVREIRPWLPRTIDRWHLDEAALKTNGATHWLWRAIGRAGLIPDMLAQGRQDQQASRRSLRKLLKWRMWPSRVMVIDKLASQGAARKRVTPPRDRRSTKRVEQPNRELV
ncbi:DDE-type integrase/transposase/recombinase [Muricoccus vinaceus]|uniref:DDE-type integrase/transposase/recombinase n=1 Tax=Muricoccus vinaceus TaxID=424704 RepID=A0ABV6ISP1_9PROT